MGKSGDVEPHDRTHWAKTNVPEGESNACGLALGLRLPLATGRLLVEAIFANA